MFILQNLQQTVNKNVLDVRSHLDEKLEVDIIGSRGGSFGPLALSTCNEIYTLDHEA
ncbi:hypothetical protein Hanom_Chr06g00477421 [Helianthus anomalus]